MARVRELVTLTRSAARAATSTALSPTPVVALRLLPPASPLEATALACEWPCASIIPIADAMRSGTPPASPASPCAPSAILARIAVPSASVVFLQSPSTSVSTAATAWEMLAPSCIAPSAELFTTCIRSSRSVAARAASATPSVKTALCSERRRRMEPPTGC